MVHAASWTSAALELRHAELLSFLREVAAQIGTSSEDIGSWANAVHEKFLLIEIHDVQTAVARVFDINDRLRNIDRQRMNRSTLSVICRLGAAHLLNSQPPN